MLNTVRTWRSAHEQDFLFWPALAPLLGGAPRAQRPAAAGLLGVAPENAGVPRLEPLHDAAVDRLVAEKLQERLGAVFIDPQFLLCRGRRSNCTWPQRYFRV